MECSITANAEPPLRQFEALAENCAKAMFPDSPDRAVGDKRKGGSAFPKSPIGIFGNVLRLCDGRQSRI